MFCQMCGNQLNEGAAFCPKCGTRIDIPSGIRVETVNENSAKPVKPKKSKKILAFLVVLFAVICAGILIRNATRTKNPITAERFITVMESKGYTVRDVTDDYADDKPVFECYVASTDYGCDIYFFDYYSETEAKNQFDSTIANLKRLTKNYSKSSVYEESGKNYSIYSAYLISSYDILYVCSVRVENVQIHAADNDSDDRFKIRADMESLGLGNRW